MDGTMLEAPGTHDTTRGPRAARGAQTRRAAALGAAAILALGLAACVDGGDDETPSASPSASSDASSSSPAPSPSDDGAEGGGEGEGDEAQGDEQATDAVAPALRIDGEDFAGTVGCAMQDDGVAVYSEGEGEPAFVAAIEGIGAEPTLTLVTYATSDASYLAEDAGPVTADGTTIRFSAEVPSLLGDGAVQVEFEGTCQQV